MKARWAIPSLLVLLLLAACDSSRREKPPAPGGEPTNRQDKAARKDGRPSSPGLASTQISKGDEGTEASLLRLREVRLRPEQLTAEVELTAEPVPLDAIPEGAEYEFRWFLNGVEMEGASGPTLEPGRFKKRQWLHCRARVVAAERSGPWQSSGHVQVLNLPPHIEPRPIGDFPIPGRVSYQIVAVDPDEDALTYQLVSPLDQGIVLDPQSGQLSWTITPEAAEALKGQAEIVFAAVDSDGAKTQGSIRITLSEKK